MKSTFILLLFALSIHGSWSQNNSTNSTGLLLNATCESSWSGWSTCFPGSSSDPYQWKERLYVLTPSQAEAEDICATTYSANYVETDSCITPETPIDDLSTLNCGSNEFKCGNGRCISSYLVCNGDNDCDDNTDESSTSNRTNCPSQTSMIVCGLELPSTSNNAAPIGERYLTGISGIDAFAPGFDILRGTFKSNVLSMAPHGSCRRQLIGGSTDSYYRIPANVASFRQLREVTVDNVKIYESGAGLLNATKAELKYNLNFGGQLLDLSGRVGLTQSEPVSSLVKESISEDQSRTYASVNTEVNTAEIILTESNNLQASTEFISRVLKLPYSTFSYDMYLKFIEDFGTHYVSTAKLGGSYKSIQVYSRCWLESVQYSTYSQRAWRQNIAECARQLFFYNLEQTQTLSSHCQNTESGQTTTLQDELADQILYVSGGSLATASDLKFNFAKSTWDTWVASIATDPVMNLKDFKLNKLSTLMQSSSIPFDSIKRRSNVTMFIDQAINIYLGVYDAQSLCLPCTPRDSDDISYDEEGLPVAQYYYGVSYLTGTSADYKCKCAYDSPPTDVTCGAVKNLAMLMLLLMSCVVAYLNTFQ